MCWDFVFLDFCCIGITYGNYFRFILVGLGGFGVGFGLGGFGVCFGGFVLRFCLV